MLNLTTTNPTEVIKTISLQDFVTLEEERDQSGLSWGPHYLLQTPKNAPLRHGETLYLNSVHVQTGAVIVDNLHHFKRTVDFLSRVTGNSKDSVARGYWHRLNPNDWIEPHHDQDSSTSHYFRKIKRYHVYPNLPDGFLPVIDSYLWHEVTNKNLSLKILDFCFDKVHAYSNHSEHSISFLVLDFYKNDI